ncbi:MAG: PAS domain S-box protein [Marinilabiliaceae bacterium]|nr:PAS domain S-box protein [Marinilabiliaceae bacterium]
MDQLKKYVLTGILILVSISTLLAERTKVLIFHSYHEGLSWTDNVNKGIRSVFDDRGNIELHFEYLDSKRNTDSLYLRKLYDLHKTKYHDIPFDVIIAVDNNALSFLLEHRDEFYQNIPIVFCGINEFSDTIIEGMHGITGVTEEPDFKATIELILKLHPKLKELVIINDNRTFTAKIIARHIREFWPFLQTKVSPRFLSELSHSELIDHISQLNDTSVVLLTVFSVDRNGRYISYHENIEMIDEVTPVPVYGGWEFYLNKGIVGGVLTSGFEQGKLAAGMAWQIIQGQSADSIPIARKGYNHLKFDYNQLTRFDINPDNLPSESIIINQPPNLWQLYKVWVILMVFFILLTVGMIYLNEQRNRIKAMRLIAMNKDLDQRVEDKTRALQQANESLFTQKERIEHQKRELDQHRNNLMALVQERTSELEAANKKLKAGRQRLLMMLDVSSDGVWEYNVKTGSFKVSSRTWEKLGYLTHEVEENIRFMLQLIHPDDREMVKKKLISYIKGKQLTYKNEFRIQRKDGQWLWVLSRGKLLEWQANKGIAMIVGTHMDITERKKSEERLRAGERRWRALYDQVQESFVICDMKGHIIDSNPAALETLGYEPHQVHQLALGDIDTLHDNDQLMSTYFKQLVADKVSINYETRLTNSKEISFPAEVSLNLIEFANERFILAALRDISKRQEVERQVLNAVIKTEEKERSRFAKDLHDSIGPLLSSLKLYLSTLEKTDNEERLQKIFILSEEAIREAMTTIREISNNLSPQTLTDYGLVSALNAFIQRLNAINVIRAIMKVEGMEKRLPNQIEVSLYRVITELINNTLKHSGASELYIQLVKTEERLVVQYKDNGCGIQEEHFKEQGGMGLVNIANRLKSIDGSVTFHSDDHWAFIAKIAILLKTN